MIVRIWHGAVPLDKAASYHRYLLETGVPDYRATPGNAGVEILKREEGGVAHFLIVTHWESMDAIGSFAGDDVEAARYYPEDADYLIEVEPRVTHYEVMTTA